MSKVKPVRWPTADPDIAVPFTEAGLRFLFPTLPDDNIRAMAEASVRQTSALQSIADVDRANGVVTIGPARRSKP